MKLLSKLILPVLALNLIASSAIIAEPKYVYELFTPKQAAVLAATTTGLFGAMAWAINEDINATVAYKEKKQKRTITVHPLKRVAIAAIPSALFAGIIGAQIYMGMTFYNIDQYLKDTAQLNETIAKTSQEILLGLGV